MRTRQLLKRRLQLILTDDTFLGWLDGHRAVYSVGNMGAGALFRFAVENAVSEVTNKGANACGRQNRECFCATVAAVVIVLLTHLKGHCFNDIEVYQ